MDETVIRFQSTALPFSAISACSWNFFKASMMSEIPFSRTMALHTRSMSAAAGKDALLKT